MITQETNASAVFFGLSTDTKPTSNVSNGSFFLEMDTGKEYFYDASGGLWREWEGGGKALWAEPAALMTEERTLDTVTANGTLTVEAGPEYVGMKKVTIPVNISGNSYTAGDEGKVVSNGALVAQSARAETITQEGTYDTTMNSSVTVSISGGGVRTISGSGTAGTPLPNGVTWSDILAGKYILLLDWSGNAYNNYSEETEQMNYRNMIWGYFSNTNLGFFEGSGYEESGYDSEGVKMTYDSQTNSLRSNGGYWSDVYSYITDSDTAWTLCIIRP